MSEDSLALLVPYAVGDVIEQVTILGSRLIQVTGRDADVGGSGDAGWIGVRVRSVGVDGVGAADEQRGFDYQVVRVVPRPVGLTSAQRRVQREGLRAAGFVRAAVMAASEDDAEAGNYSECWLHPGIGSARVTITWGPRGVL